MFSRDMWTTNKKMKKKTDFLNEKHRRLPSIEDLPQKNGHYLISTQRYGKFLNFFLLKKFQLCIGRETSWIIVKNP